MGKKKGKRSKMKHANRGKRYRGGRRTSDTLGEKKRGKERGAVSDQKITTKEKKSSHSDERAFKRGKKKQSQRGSRKKAEEVSPDQYVGTGRVPRSVDGRERNVRGGGGGTVSIGGKKDEEFKGKPNAEYRKR